MSDYSPPIGKELAIAKKVLAIINRIENLEIDHPWSIVPSISAEFATKGVRTNGNLRLSTVMDVVAQLSEEYKHLRESTFGTVEARMMETIKRAKQTLALIEKAKQLVSGLELCPACKGMKGCGSCGGRPPWKDCDECWGRGVVDETKRTGGPP